MTVGQRVAQKRKELGLSQEALGEQMGVSRQAIYKWESDASLPEIEKLVALSRVFSVSVGWLLGVEEETDRDASIRGELTEAQLKMVQEIADRYLAAQPAPVPVAKRRRWPFAVAAAVLLLVFFNLFSRLDSLGQEYNNLQNSIGNVSHNVDSQISSITNRVEELLKSQNALTASYGTALLSTDPAAGTATFSARAVPKTHTEGMNAIFLADSGDGPTEFVGVPGPGGEFTAQISCALTNEITLSVVFLADDRSETQVLDQYTWLYEETFPSVQVQSNLWGSIGADGQLREEYAYIRREDGKTGVQAEIENIRVGLFRDGVLVVWYEPCEKPETFVGFEEEEFFRRPSPVTLEAGPLYCVAAVITDEYGRDKVWIDAPVTYDPEEGFLNFVDGVAWSSEPEEWKY